MWLLIQHCLFELFYCIAECRQLRSFDSVADVLVRVHWLRVDAVDMLLAVARFASDDFRLFFDNRCQHVWRQFSFT